MLVPVLELVLTTMDPMITCGLLTDHIEQSELVHMVLELMEQELTVLELSLIHIYVYKRQDFLRGKAETTQEHLLLHKKM